MNRFNILEIDNFRFLMMPKALFTYKKYKLLSSECKLAYTLFLDKLHLSKKNNWIEGNGDIYFYYSYEQLAQDLNIKSRNTIAKIYKDLRIAGLLESRREAKGVKLYLNKLEIPDSADDIIEEPELDNPEDDEVSRYNKMVEEEEKSEKLHSNPYLTYNAQKMNYGSTKNCTMVVSPVNIPENDDTDAQKMNYGSTKNCTMVVPNFDKPKYQKLYSNNTNISNTIYSNSNSNNRVSQNDDVKNDTLVKDIGSVFSAFENNIGPITKEKIKDELLDLIDSYGVLWLNTAISVVNKYNSKPKNIKYLASILSAWDQIGFDKSLTPREQASVYEPLSMLLADSISAVTPAFQRPTDFDLWNSIFFRMVEHDKRSREEIKRIIMFSSTNTFWRKVILSPKDIAKNYVRLSAEIEHTSTPEQNMNDLLALIAEGEEVI